MSETQLVHVLHKTLLGMVRSNTDELNTRQLGAFLICYLDEGKHTVRGLAKGMNVPSPSISRAVSRLIGMGLVHRQRDPFDRRKILIHRTKKGDEFLREISEGMCEAVENTLHPN